MKSGIEVQTTMERNGETKALMKAKKETLGERVEKEPVPFTSGRIMFPDNPSKITMPLLYPQRFKKKNLDEQFSKFLEVFCNNLNLKALCWLIKLYFASVVTNL